MRMDALMEKVAFERLHVIITSFSGRTYEGNACGYTKADDEEEGISTVCISTSDDGGWCLAENEIRSIEIVYKA